MKRPYSFIRDLDSLLAAIAGFLIIHAFTRHSGIGVSPDSVVYMSTAANIRQHGAINDFTGMPMMDFPACYPVFLSTIMWLTGKTCLQFAPALNGLLFAGLIYLAGWMMERFTFRSRLYKWIILSCIVVSPCLLEIYAMLWSETLFLLLLLSFLAVARRYFIQHHPGILLIIGLIAGLATVTRYAGISLIFFGGLLLVADRRLPWRKKIAHIALFGVIAIIPVALNIYRNKLVTGTLTGYREKALASFGTNLYHFGTVLCDWLPFFNERYSAAAWVGVISILLCLGALLYQLFKGKTPPFSYERLAGSWFLVYTGFILLVASVSRFQTLDSRLLSPLFIPWLWGISSWIPERVSGLSTGFRKWIAAGIACAAAACFIGGEWNNYQESWNGIKYAGIPGYAEDQWTHSQTMDFLKHSPDLHQPDVSIYSNAYEGIWFFTGLQSDIIPHRDIPADVKEMMEESGFYVVWFDDALNTDLLTIEDIKKHKKLAREYKFDDGTVYFFTTL